MNDSSGLLLPIASTCSLRRSESHVCLSLVSNPRFGTSESHSLGSASLDAPYIPRYRLEMSREDMSGSGGVKPA